MLELKNITKTYHKSSSLFTALDNISLKVDRGDYLLVSGPSGAGKSTLLYVAGGMIRPDAGEVKYEGEDISGMNNKAKNEYRRKHVGFVFQQFHLMPFLSVLENIKMACYERSQLEAVDSYMEKCFLTPLRNKKPSELSVGEKQRTAFVRAIITRPGLLLADEPTGNLDPANSEILMSLIDDFHREGGTVLLVSHNPVASKYAGKQIVLSEGKIVSGE
ncbi:MAG TPA: ABC transporter ATP-binding protein [Bacteroidales bacterium]|jgi:ABC-type lipoprotein export system ATPase subunit|nr:ABC transporter ATP-binding protein [Bacteroidales bacterium]HOS73089.1 ABC transporter ATP-binding protein [Bacteroidales bacterium]HQH23556.1 ABC transporter ATP-binding protein [Bacteroidales bacterium]HQJ81078.1 ABC transporter ATP-binding protein [Bacteroidales bacterium]